MIHAAKVACIYQMSTTLNVSHIPNDLYDYLGPCYVHREEQNLNILPFPSLSSGAKYSRSTSLMSAQSILGLQSIVSIYIWIRQRGVKRRPLMSAGQKRFLELPLQQPSHSNWVPYYFHTDNSWHLLPSTTVYTPPTCSSAFPNKVYHPANSLWMKKR